MPSFDTISEINKHELQNALDQTKRELENRFDFRGVKTTIEHKEKDNEILLGAPSDFQLDQLRAVLEGKLIKRQIDPQSLEFKDPEINVQECRQTIKLKQGIDQETAKKINKLIKDNKFKVQSTIQGDKVRVTGKDRDELQAVMAFLRKTEIGLPLQFDNFRD
jgi:uncharacterized protein YajQ (UPF0234 family)